MKFSPEFCISTRWILLSIVMIFAGKAQSQCNPPDQLPTQICQTAPFVCLNNACYETLQQPLGGYNGFCGSNTAVHNPQYFTIVVQSVPVQINIYVNSCSSGSGLQSALINSCPWNVGFYPDGNVLDCPDNPSGTGPGGTMVLITYDVQVGDTIWLLIDGSSGATCEYTINYVAGIELPGLENDLTYGEAIPQSVCQGYNGVLLTAGPMVGNAHGYIWTLGWSGETVTSTLPQYSANIPAGTPPGDYQVCVRAFSGCDEMDHDICFSLNVYEIPPGDRDPITLCPEEFPINWHSMTISGPGTYHQTFNTPEGCVFDSTWVVNQYPIVPVGVIDTLHCFESFVYEGETYENAGTYTLEYPGQGLNGCDSSTMLNLTLAYISAEIVVDGCEDQHYVLRPFIEQLIPANAAITWYWYDEFGNLIHEGLPLLVPNPGTYSLRAIVATNVGECTFDIPPITFEADDYVPDPPVFPAEYFPYVQICAQSEIFFQVADPNGENVCFNWYTTAGNIPIYQDCGSTAEFDFYNATSTTVCVYSTNECGDGPPACFDVEIIPSPVAQFTLPTEGCAGEPITLTFTGTASPTSTVVWDFAGATVTGEHPGPFTLVWDTPGNKTVQLTITEPGCNEVFDYAIITISNLLPPTLNCSSTISSVSFDWTDVPGVTEYLITINGGAPFSTGTTSEYMIDGLNPGDPVTLVLNVVHPGPCELEPIVLTCNAAPCPPPAIVITAPDSVCLNAPQVYDLGVTVNGDPGVGTWSGPGITDPAEGLFDPRIAGPGIHQILFAVDINDCVTTTPTVIEVFDSLTADFVIDPTVICITETATVTYTGNGTAATTYNYNFGMANVLSGSGDGPYELGWNTPGQKTVRLQVTENGCVSDLITQNIDVVPNLSAAVLSCTPNTSGVLFTWTTDPLAASVEVNILTGHTGTQTGNSYDFGGLTAGDVVTIEIVSLSAGPCPDRRDTLSCEARECPPIMIDIEPVSNICLYPGTSTVALDVEVTGSTGAGSGLWSGPGIVDQTNGIFDPVAAGPGAHSLVYRFSDDGCDFTSSITVNVYDVPEAFISNTDLTITCVSSTLMLDGTGSSGGPLNYAWSTTDGSILNGTNQAVAEVGSAGTYTLNVTNSVSGCFHQTSVTVTREASIPDAVGGPDATLNCDVTTVTLGGASTSGPTITYLWTTTNGNIVGAADGSRVDVDMPGDYTLRVRDESNGCEASDVVTVVLDTVVSNIVLTPGEIIDCDTPLSGVESTLSDPGNYAYTWSTQNGRIEGAVDGANVQVSQGGTYTLTIVNLDNGCERTSDAVVDESDEIINDVEVSLTNIMCFGQNNGALVINNVMGGTPPYIYEWSVSTPDGTMLSNLGPGQYSLTVTDVNGCSYSRVFNLSQPAQVTVDLGPNKIVAQGDEVGIEIETNVDPGAIGEIAWSPYDGKDCPGCLRFEFVATSSATITAMVTDTAGCSALDSMRLTVIVPRIYYIPNVFSPNGDNINDYFTIFGRPNLTNINSLRIYDRWGNQVFERQGLTPGIESEGWDGTFNDKLMQPGVYTYWAELQFEDQSKEVVTGDITLIR